MEENQEQVEISKYLILDTNVFSRMGDDTEIGKKIISYLEDLINKSPGWGLAISQFTLFETMNELPYLQELTMSDTLSNFPAYPVDRENLYMAAHLGCLYADHYKDLKTSDKMPEPGDKIIAAETFRNDTLLCTSNMRDYPAPFFKEVIREVLSHQTKKGLAHTVLYIMQPQVTLINEYYQKRIDSHRKNTKQKPSVKKVAKKAVNKKKA